MSKPTCLSVAFLAILPALPAAAPAPASMSARLDVFPRQIVLRHAHDSQRLIVSIRPALRPHTDGGTVVGYQSAHPDVAQVSAAGVVRPVKAGSTIVTVRHGAAVATVAVTVIDARP